MRGSSKNKSFYHYTVTPLIDVVAGVFGEKEYYYTRYDIKEKYNISIQTISRIIKNPAVKTKFKHLIERTYIHHTIKDHIV
jgi:hypothetical protein